MSQTGYTPIQLYYSTTASTAPTAGNLASGELAINITDGKLFYKDNAGVVQTLATSTTANGAANGVLYLNSSKIATAGTALVFDGTNLGLGVNPSAWRSGDVALDIGAVTALVTAQSTNTRIYNNTYVASGNRNTYKTTGFASYYDQGTGVHRWFNAPSGLVNTTTIVNAGVYIVYALGSSTLSQWQAFFSGLAALPTVGQSITATASGTLLGGGTVSQTITFTQAMTLDASGNLGIGTTLPARPLEVLRATAGFVSRRGYSSGQSIYEYTDATAAYISTGSNLYNAFGINETSSYLNFYTANAERARIDSSGNLGIGTTSPNASAILDAQSTTKGVRFPNMTTTQKNAISSPAAGLVVFDTTLAKLCVYSGSAWQTITSI